MRNGKGIVLPKWLQGCMSAQWNSLTVTLVYALSLHHHGTPDQIRAVSLRMRDKVYLEHRPKMKALAKINDDARVMKYAKELVENVTDALGIYPGTPFPVKPPPEPDPECCKATMKLSGYHAHRHWKCVHCGHTQPVYPTSSKKGETPHAV